MKNERYGWWHLNSEKDERNNKMRVSLTFTDNIHIMNIRHKELFQKHYHCQHIKSSNQELAKLIHNTIKQYQVF